MTRLASLCELGEISQPNIKRFSVKETEQEKIEGALGVYW